MRYLLFLSVYFFVVNTASAQSQQVIDSLNRAYRNATHDTTRVLVLTEIASFYLRSKSDTALSITDKALQLSETANFKKGTGKVFYTIGLFHQNRNKYPLALEYYQKNLKIQEEIRDKKGLATTFNSIGNVYYYQGNYPSALEYYQKGLKTNEETGDKKSIAASLGNIGNIYNNQSNYTLALEFYQKSLKIKEEIGDKRGIATSFHSMGAIYSKTGNDLLALEYYRKNLDMQQEIGDKRVMAASLTNLGNIYSRMGNYPLALEYYQKSVKINEEVGNKTGIASSLNNAGVIYSKLGNSDKALAYHQEGLKINEELGDRKGIATNSLNIGIIYNSQKKYSLALEYYQKSLKTNEEIGDKRGALTTMNSIGMLYSTLGNLTLALEHYQKSLKIAEGINDKEGQIYSLNGLAQVTKQQQQDFDKSILYAQKGLQIAQEVKTPAEIKALSETLYQTYKLKGDYVKALEYHELYKSINDSLFNVDKAKAIANLEAKAEVERKEKEIALLSKDKDLLQKDNELQRIENERQRNARLALEKQAEADRLFSLARQEQDMRKQDSLMSLATRKKLEAEKLKAIEQSLKADNRAKILEIQREKDENQQQLYINYGISAGLLVVLILSAFIYRTKEKVQIQNKEILRKNDEINQQKEEIQAQAQQLSTANATKDKLFAIIGHDLRSPIASLQGIFTLIASGGLTQQEFESVSKNLLEGVNNVSFTLNNLLNWANSQMKGIEPIFSAIQLSALAQENIDFLENIAQNKKITLHNHISRQANAWADTNQISLVFRNLISNAIKFTPPGGSVSVDAESDVQYWKVTIQDTGVGIPGEKIDLIFRKNQSFTTYGTQGEKGTGLGLTLCQEMIEKNNGQIGVESEPGQGTTFWFALPIFTGSTH